jgi:[ribosomal protein S5]-alanine N-acetyltransferase
MQKIPIPAINGQTICLEPIGLQHINADYIGWLNDAEVNRFLDVRFYVPQTRESLVEYINTFRGPIENYGWAIRALDGNAMIGTISIPRVDRVHMSAGIGMMIGDKKFWGTRAAKEAFGLVMEFAFEKLGLRRLAEHNVALNHQSNFMLRTAGFRHEGTLKKAYRLTLGTDTFVDGFEFALLADEWRERRAKEATK